MFKCKLCGKTSQPRERIGGHLPTQVREVEYHTPLVTPTGRPLGEKVSTGRETVKMGVVCAKCATTPPEPEVVSDVTIRTQPDQVIDRRWRNHGDRSQEEGAQ